MSNPRFLKNSPGRNNFNFENGCNLLNLHIPLSPPEALGAFSGVSVSVSPVTAVSRNVEHMNLSVICHRRWAVTKDGRSRSPLPTATLTATATCDTSQRPPRPHGDHRHLTVTTATSRGPPPPHGDRRDLTATPATTVEQKQPTITSRRLTLPSSLL